MSTWQFIPFISLVALGTASCSNERSRPGPDDPGLADYLAQLVDAVCDHRVACYERDRDDCLASIDFSDLTTCDQLATFYSNNRSQLDACLANAGVTCTGPDAVAFCPLIGDFDFDLCSDTPPPTPGAGEAGTPCDIDSDCMAGMRCLQSFSPGVQGYCSVRCSVADDCRGPTLPEAPPFLANTMTVVVSGEFGETYNRWNSNLLWRGAECIDLADAPVDIGVPDGDSWCVFICPARSAVQYEAPGDQTAVGCSCMPNFARTTATELECVWDAAQECSIFVGCDATNTMVAECSAGDFRCIVNEDLEGLCYDFLSGDRIEMCVAECTWDCDSGCLARTCTGSNADACTAACCTSTNPACD